MSKRLISLPEAIRLLDDLPSDNESLGSSDGDEEDDDDRMIETVAEMHISDDSNDTIPHETNEDSDEAEASTSHDSKVRWSKTFKQGPSIPFTGSSGPTDIVMQLDDPSPYDLVCLFLSQDVFDLMVFQTNLYAQQSGKRFQPITDNEMRTFIGINILMGL